MNLKARKGPYLALAFSFIQISWMMMLVKNQHDFIFRAPLYHNALFGDTSKGNETASLFGTSLLPVAVDGTNNNLSQASNDYEYLSTLGNPWEPFPSKRVLPTKNESTPTISTCIPGLAGDLDLFAPGLFKSIMEQRVKADEVVLAVSDVQRVSLPANMTHQQWCGSTWSKLQPKLADNNNTTIPLRLLCIAVDGWLGTKCGSLVCWRRHSIVCGFG